MATTIRISPDDVVLEDVLKTADLTATVLDQNGVAMADIPVEWTSSDSDIAAVSKSGRVTGRAAGTTTVQASAEGVVGQATIVVELGEVGVLHVFHEEMGGDGWEDDSNWKTGAPLYTWHGVRTEDTMPPRGVAELSLIENGLTGALPPEVGTLHTLRFLVLFGNRITGSIPPELGDSLRLISVDLSGNQLAGPIPPELGNLNNLQEGLLRLDLSDNRLAGSIPGELGNRVYLTDFDLSNNELTGPIPAELGNLSELNSLSIFGNPLTGPLPRELIGLPLTLFHWHDTDLCAPTDDDFQEWLHSIEDHRGNGDCDS